MILSSTRTRIALHSGLSYLLSSRPHGADYKSSHPFIMKAFILAAGSGTRLRPLTDTVPKCLLPIQGVPLLQIWLENCSVAGITDVLVNVHSHAGHIREFASKECGNLAVRIAEVQ